MTLAKSFSKNTFNDLKNISLVDFLLITFRNIAKQRK